MKNNVRKKMTSIITVAMAMVTIAACSNSNASDSKAPSRASDTEVSVKKNSIIIATESEPPTLHPFDHKAVTAGMMNDLTFNTLFTSDIKNLSPVPSLVNSYENISETEWVFTIHEGVKFHNGEVMNAADAVASLEYARSYPTTKDYSSFWSELEVIDDTTFKITTKEPYSGVLTDLVSIKVVPKSLIDAGHDFNASPIGSGPYKLVKQTFGDKIEFEIFDDYFDTANKPTIQTMVWKIIPEGSSRTIALEAGEVDLVIEVETTDINRLEAMDNIDVVKVAGTRHNFFSMNAEYGPFANKDFRKAVNAAIDREAVVMVAVNGVGSESIAQVPSCFEGYTEENTQGYDIEKAKEYLAASGIDPATVKFECLSSSDVNRRTAEVIQACLKEIGIEMSIVSMDYATYLNAIMSGNYQTAIAGYTSTNLGSLLQGLYHKDSINAANLSRISLDSIDEGIAASKRELDTEKRIDIYEETISIINELTPYAPLYDTTVTRAYNSKLGGVAVSPSAKMEYNKLYWID